MLLCGRTCTCDIFSFSKYSHSLKGTSAMKFERTIKNKDLKALEAQVAKTMLTPDIIKPEKFKSTLETRRDVQREDSMEFVTVSKGQLATVESWLV
jgi:hypothetical protein